MSSSGGIRIVFRRTLSLVEQKGVAGGGRKLRPVQQNVAFQLFTDGIYRAGGLDGLHGIEFWESGADEHL